MAQSTIARPGEPAAIRGRFALAFRAASDAWIPGSYEPKPSGVLEEHGAGQTLGQGGPRHDEAALYT